MTGLPVGFGISAAASLFGVLVAAVLARRATALLARLERLGLTACHDLAGTADGSTVVAQVRTIGDSPGSDFAWHHHTVVRLHQMRIEQYDETVVSDVGGGPVATADPTGTALLNEDLARRQLVWPGESLFTTALSRSTWPGNGQQALGTQGETETCEVVNPDIPVVVIGVVARQADSSVRLRDDWGRFGVYLGERADLIVCLDARRLRCRRVAGWLALVAALLLAGSGIAAFAPAAL